MDRRKMEPDKICPILTQGFIVAYYRKTNCTASGMEVNNNSLHSQMPKCLKEDCELWISPYIAADISKVKGRCGLKNYIEYGEE